MPYSHQSQNTSGTGTLHVLLAALLLAFSARCGMSILIADWIHTSNELLRHLMAKHAPTVPKHQVISQSAEDVQNVENAPAVSVAMSSPGREIS
jgi:hypothetical protein